jgi:hypothetical protein
MKYMNGMKEFVITSVLVAVICLAAVPAASAAMAYTLVSHTPDGYDAPLYKSGDTLTFGMTDIPTGYSGFTWNFYSDDLVLEDGYSTISTTTYLPIGFAADGTTVTTFKTTGMTNPVTYTMSRNGGMEYSVTGFGDGTPITTNLNIGKGNYAVSASGTKSGGTQGIDWTIAGGQIATIDSGDPLYFTLLIPAHVKSGHLKITCTDNLYKGEGREIFSYWFRIGEDTPTTETTAPVTTSTTVPEGPSDAGGGGAAVIEQAGPLENGTFMMLKHDDSGNLIADYEVELDGTYGFKSNLNLARPLTVLDSYGKPVDEIKINTIDPNSILDLTKSNVFTFSGFAVECEPPGTQFTNGFALLKITLTDDQWAAALAAANGNTAAMTFKTYDPDSGTWVDVPTIVDPVTHTITAQISHFSMYGLFYGTEAAEQTFGNLMPTSTGGAAQQAPVVTTGAQLAPTSTTKSPALPGIVVIGVVGLVAYFVVRKKE